MEIQWYGHSCFRLTNASGFTVVTDPFDPTVGYPLPTVTADLVTVSHDHFDHNHVQLVDGVPKVARQAGDVAAGHVTEGVSVRGVASFHDEVQGRRRGANVIFVIQLDGLRVVHLGDLGHQLSAAQVAEIGPVDVLLVPVGGTFTIDARGAFEVCEALRPELVFPMHYRTPACRVEVAPVETFLQLCPEVERPGVTTLTLDKAEVSRLRPFKVVVPNYR